MGCWALRGAGAPAPVHLQGGCRTAGFEAVLEARKTLRDGMLAHPPRWFRARDKKAAKEARAKAKAEAAAAAAAAAASAVRAADACVPLGGNPSFLAGLGVARIR